jgi:hypothetical protein
MGTGKVSCAPNRLAGSTATQTRRRRESRAIAPRLVTQRPDLGCRGIVRFGRTEDGRVRRRRQGPGCGQPERLGTRCLR